MRVFTHLSVGSERWQKLAKTLFWHLAFVAKKGNAEPLIQVLKKLAQQFSIEDFTQKSSGIDGTSVWDLIAQTSLETKSQVKSLIFQAKGLISRGKLFNTN